jgi:hypothetical protein
MRWRWYYLVLLLVAILYALRTLDQFVCLSFSYKDFTRHRAGPQRRSMLRWVSLRLLKILQDPSTECTAIAAVADGSRCRMEVRSQPVLVAFVVFHWPARVWECFARLSKLSILHRPLSSGRTTSKSGSHQQQDHVDLRTAQMLLSTAPTFLVDRHGEVQYGQYHTTARVNTARYRRLAIWILYLVVQVVRRTAQLQRRTSS